MWQTVLRVGCLAGLLSACGNYNPVTAWQRMTSAAGGPAALKLTDDNGRQLEPPELIAQSYHSCDEYRRSLSVTHRTTSANLALGSATAGALGLAFMPAGTATLAAFTAAGSILAGASSNMAGTSYASLTPQTMEQRFRIAYNAEMEKLAANPTGTNVGQIASIHSRCSLAYILGEPTN